MTAERRLRFDSRSGRVAIEFPYDRGLIALVREIPGRRWDPGRKVWTAPLEMLSEVVRVLQPRGFLVEPGLAQKAGAVAGAGDARAAREAAGGRGEVREEFAAGPARSLEDLPSFAELPPADEEWMAWQESEGDGGEEAPPIEVLEMDPVAETQGGENPPAAPAPPTRPRPVSAAPVAEAAGRSRVGPAAPTESVSAHPAAPAPAAAAVARSHVSVSELNEHVRNALRNRFPRAIWLVGQLSGWDRNSHKQHIFFELTEKDSEGLQDIARVTAVLFGGMHGRIGRRLEEAGGDLRLQDGVQVRLRVKVDLYVRSGSYQVVVEDIDPAYTLGTLALNRERVYKELEARGLVGRNRELADPPLPLRIALVTSWGSDAANDVLAELRRSGYAFVVDCYDAYMQGPQLRGSVVAALERIALNAESYDLCMICRGGGSRTDLAWFDDLEVAVRVAQLPLPVVVGIGHHRDVSVLDLIARSEKTPTAAAASLVARVAEAEALLEERRERLERLGLSDLRSAGLDLTHRVARFRRATGAAARLAREGLEARRARLERAREHALAVAGRRLAEVSATTVFLARRALQEELRAVTERGERLRRAGLAVCARESALLESRRREIQAQDPARLLARGFAIVRSRSDGRVMTRIAQARSNTEIQIELRDGLIDAHVDRVEERSAADVATDPEERNDE